MRIHADFSQTVILKPEDHHWVKSPAGEVNRMMLDRIGKEHARATSLVEFAPQSKFPAHNHPLGEELLVLSGTFTELTDQHYPAGWYMRNPHNSAHEVSSETGCLILVKLRQMTEQELEPVRINTLDQNNWQTIQNREICPLFQNDFEHTYLEKLQPEQQLDACAKQGLEIFILSGGLISHNETYPTKTWIRLPPNSSPRLSADVSGALLYIKSGHLEHAMHVWGK